ncbi:MAG TPA: NADH-quinone oxidoreductase subunit C, partial [Candidatus Competibacteraceae bacterium]|nr:NADH-quinone oxidoreductase subunit C [Candidatus Competibacteraceae bacterium]
MTANFSLAALLATGESVAAQRPWPRAVVSSGTWTLLVEQLAGGALTLLGLWGEPGVVHLAAWEPASGALGVASLSCPAGRFPSVGRWHPPAIRLERALAELCGLQAEGNPDHRPWLDHGHWRLRHPLGAAQPVEPTAEPYPFLPAEGESLHQIPVGPVHAGIIEPGHFRFTANGETVVRLEERLGYVHKGIERLLAGATLEHAARLAGRVSGDS